MENVKNNWSEVPKDILILIFERLMVEGKHLSNLNMCQNLSPCYTWSLAAQEICHTFAPPIIHMLFLKPRRFALHASLFSIHKPTDSSTNAILCEKPYTICLNSTRATHEIVYSYGR